MRKNNLLKIFVILVVIAICLVAFVGIYQNKQGRMENILPDYLLGMELSGGRVIKLKVNDTAKEVIYDSEGKVATDGKNEDGSLKDGYTKQEEKVNKEEVLTEDNFKVSKQIMEQRLKKLGVQEYNIRMNKENGDIFIELPDEVADEIVSYLSYQGKFEIQDSETQEVLLTNDKIAKARVGYGAESTGTKVYLTIEFNKEGGKKLEEISKLYTSTKDEEGNTNTKKIAIKIDDETMVETSFSETITSGVLNLSIGTASNSNTELQQFVKQGTGIATIIESGKMEVKYTLDQNRYLKATVTEQEKKIILSVTVAIVILIMLFFIISKKKTGILLAISYLGFIASLLIILRYTNVIISKEAIVAFLTILFSSAYVINEMVKEKEKILYRLISIAMPIVIIAVVFTFINWTPIATIGMVMFWGIIVMLAYHYLITKNLIQKDSKEE